MVQCPPRSFIRRLRASIRIFAMIQLTASLTAAAMERSGSMPCALRSRSSSRRELLTVIGTAGELRRARGGRTKKGLRAIPRVRVKRRNDGEPPSGDCPGDACEGCGGSGIRCPATPSCRLAICGDGWIVVERCDMCDLYADDLAAASVLFHETRWVICASGGPHAIGRGATDPNRATC